MMGAEYFHHRVTTISTGIRMALIGTKNLLAPLYNKVHLAAIVLFTIAFTVLRLSGGAVYARPKAVKATPASAEERSDDEYSGGKELAESEAEAEEAMEVEAEEEENYRRPSSPAAARRMAQERAVEKKQQAAAEEEEVEKRKGLSDIEQMLGMQ
jgi:hypothetical protein